MNKKNKTKYVVIGIVGLIALLVIGYFVFIGGKMPGVKQTGTSINGKYNPTTGECEPSGNSAMFFTCCYNQEGQQVDCNDASKLLSMSPLAIYKGTPGIYTIQHGVQIVNTGNVDFSGIITGITVSASPTFASGVTALNTAYTGMINNAKPVTKTVPATWSSTQITLQDLSPTMVLETYTVTVNAKGTASGQTDVTKSSGPQTFTVEAEGLNFDVSISF